MWSCLKDCLQQRLGSHCMSTIALCCSVFCTFFLLMSAFPYSGFMAIQLVPGLTEETVGPYAGMIVSSFMVGRALSSYIWGKMADRYGRRFVLITSLSNAAIFSIGFGLSNSLHMAMMCRFLLGFGNGIMLVARTSITELAKGDRELEKRGMGLVMSMVGYGMLLCPAIGGTLSEPLLQYPNSQLFRHGEWEVFLTKYPFFLPNLIGCILCSITLFFVICSVEETLPDDRRRDLKYLIPDLIQGLCGFCRCCFCCGRDDDDTDDDRNKHKHYNDNFADLENKKSITDSITTSRTTCPIPTLLEDLSWDEKKDDGADEGIHILKQADQHCDELSVLVATPASRAFYSSALQRPPQQQQQGEPFCGPGARSPTVQSIMSKKSTRDHLIAYWVNAFYNVAVNEAFPLFAMSKTGGLGWTEARIGGIGTAAGFIFCICQYFIFSRVMDHHTVHQGLRISCFWGNVPVVLIPLSLVFQRQKPYGDEMSFVFLSLLYGVIAIYTSVFYGCVTISTNRTVDAAHRATMNGLSGLGAGAGRAIGPLFAGVLVAFSMSDFVPPPFGSVVLYLILTMAGLLAFSTTLYLEDDM